MATFFQLKEEQREEYLKVNHDVCRELDFWAIHNNKFLEDDKAYWALLQSFESYMESPSPGNYRRLNATIISYEAMGADADWLWEIHDELVHFVQSRLWPWFLELWREICEEDCKFMEKLLQSEAGVT